MGSILPEQYKIAITAPRLTPSGVTLTASCFPSLSPRVIAPASVEDEHVALNQKLPNFFLNFFTKTSHGLF
jgi:hypothetical protein